MLRHHAAFVLDDVAGAGAALDGHVAQTRVDVDVDAVERCWSAPPTLSVNVWKLSMIAELRRLHVAERQRVAAAARQPRVRGTL